MTKKDEVFIPLPNGRGTKSNFLEHQQTLKALAAKHTIRRDPGEPLPFTSSHPELPKEALQELFKRVRQAPATPTEELDPASPDLTPEQKEAILLRARNDPMFFFSKILKPGVKDPTLRPLQLPVMMDVSAPGILDQTVLMLAGRDLLVATRNRRAQIPIDSLNELIAKNLAARKLIADFVSHLPPVPKPRNKILARRRIKRRGRKN